VVLFPYARNFTHIAPVYPVVKWGPGEACSPPSCNINGQRVITGEANVQLLSMGEVQMELQVPTPSPWGPTCRVLALSQMDVSGWLAVPA